MNRKEFLSLSSKATLGVYFMPALLSSCKKDELEVNFTGKVLIVGAGAAGMMAGYSLFQNGIDFEIIEALSTFGGRVRMNNTFSDFPMDIGAEWIHEKPSFLKRLVNDENVEGSVDLIPYQLETLKTWSNGTLTDLDAFSPTYGQYKFKNTTWFQFFQDYIISNFIDKVHFNSPVNSIDYNGDHVIITDSYGNTYTGDKVIVTVPMNILKTDMISFSPALPNDKIDAINSVEMSDGLKVYLKFSERFYPDLLAMGGLSEFMNDGRLYFDVAFKKNTNENVLGLFNVRGKAHELTSLESDQEIIDTALAELDEVFDGKASQFFIEGLVQNWSKDPFVQGAYSFYGDEYSDLIPRISEPVDSKVYFAGEALNIEEWSTVHGAGFNGREVAETIMTQG